MQEHTVKAFDADIEGLRSAVLAMGGLVERQLDNAIEALSQADLSRVAQVLADEDLVNHYHVQCDLLCNQILARRQPFAIDLREVIGALHTVNDLERAGDEAKKIALRSREMRGGGRQWIEPVSRIHAMAQRVRAMLTAALDAVVRHDAQAAARLGREDLEVDALRDDIHALLMDRMGHAGGSITEGVGLVFVVQSLERIGDHAKNIAETVVQVVDGVDLRHGAPELLRA